MRVVVDTNVFVSGLINPRGAPGAIVDAVIEGRIVTGDSDFERDRYGGVPGVSASMLAAVLAKQQSRIP